MKQSKLFKANLKKYKTEDYYSPSEAFSVLNSFETAKFDESVEVHFSLGIDPRHADQQLRGTYSFPHGNGKSKIILAIAEGANASAAEEAGADFVGVDEYLEKIQKGWYDFDIIITTPDMMKKFGRLGKQLGSKGLMPNPKAGTVTKDISAAIKEFKSGKFEYRNDKNGILHVVIGKKSFEQEKLFDNFNAFYDFLLKIKPTKAKGTYFKSISLCSTQSPSILIEPMKVKWK